MVQDKKGRDMNKQEEREYWTKLLADGPVWCEVWDDGCNGKPKRLVLAYVGGTNPFVAMTESSREEALRRSKTGVYSVAAWQYARPFLAKPRRPWNADEIMAHGVFCPKNIVGKTVIYKVVDVGSDSENTVYYLVDGKIWDRGIADFCATFDAVCLELRDGILCDTGKRVELYKDGE